VSVTIKGIDKLLKKLDKVSAIKTLEPPMNRAVIRLEGYMKEYPTNKPAPIQGPQYLPVRFTTGAGRAVSFVAKAREPYVRTGSLGRSWTHRVTKSANGLVGTVGNRRNYAPYVQSERFQAKLHRATGWRTDQQAIERNRAAIVVDFKRAIDQALEG
jgi:hypothetical protein